MSSSSSAQSSFLLWTLALGVALLTAHVALGWVRQAQHEAGLRRNWRPLLLAAATIGTGVCSAMVLAVAAEALPFRVGYRAAAVPVLWLGAMVGALPVAWLLSRTQRWPALMLGGAVLACLATAVQIGWLWAVGFRPGIVWRNEFIGSAAVLMTVGHGIALWVAYSSISQQSDRRQLWRLGAAVLIALSLVAGQEILMAGAGLLGQVGSVYAKQVPGTVLSLVAGVLVPMVAGAMAVELGMRRSRRRRPSNDPSNSFASQRKHKRRQRSRGL